MSTNSVLTHMGNYREMLSHLTSICKIFELQQDSRTVGRKALEFSLLKRVLAAFTNIFCIVVLIRSMLLIKLLTYRYRSDIDQPISFQATCWRNLFNDRLNILQENSNSFFYECRTFWWSIPTFLHCAQEPFRTLTKIIQDTYRPRLKTNNIKPTTPLPVKHVGAHCCPEVDGPESDG